MPTYDCGDFEERILDYDELSAGERITVDAHVAGCVACRELLSALVAVDSTLSREIPAMLAPVRPSVLPLVFDFAGWAAVIAAVLGAAMFITPEAVWPALALVVISGTFWFLAASWRESEC